MAVYSMTGYASASAGAPAEAAGAGAIAEVVVEMRSVNGRFLDLALRLPDELRGLEPQLRDLVASGLRRGKVELRIATRSGQDDAWPQPSPEQLNRLSHLDAVVRNWLPEARGLTVHEALQWCRGAREAAALDEPTLAAARAALAALREAREREGARLAAVLGERVAHLRALAAQAEPMVLEVVRRQQQRFVER